MNINIRIFTKTIFIGLLVVNPKVAIVLGVISEKINITIVNIIDPSKTFPPKQFIIIIVTIAEARILAKLFPTKIADNNWSGLLNKLNALLALLLDFFDKFFSLILLAAIVPVSEPEKNPLIINSDIKVRLKTKRDGVSSIRIL